MNFDSDHPDFHHVLDNRAGILETSDERVNRETEPRDPYHVAAATLFLFGIASLLPWHFFISATSYWDYKFRDLNNCTARSRLQDDFYVYLSIASKVPYIIFLLVNARITQYVALRHRLIWPLVACIILFAVVAALAEVDTDDEQFVFLGVTLGLVVLINVFCGFLQGAGTGLAGCLPSFFMVIMTNGQGVGGIFATVCQLLCLLLNVSPQTTGVLYFSIAVGMLIMTLIMFIIQLNLSFTKHYLSKQATATLNSTRRVEIEIPYWRIFCQGWELYIGVVVIYWVTLAAFPALCGLIQSPLISSDSIHANNVFKNLACFMNFNLFSVIGRVASSYLPVGSSRKRLILMLCISRVVFIPLLMLCNLSPDKRRAIPVLFPEDWEYVVITAMFAFTNGYTTNLVMVFACKTTSPEYEEVAGSLSAVFLGVGLCVGALTGFPLVKLLHL
ncbi:equilibrative nucleoside transporter 2 [Galendromus occidentalis]|uniref:Equilibrative nucleoside transporter 2 n=1 Tax=Galendromus occidentalis TaxID=34638 RepID=A0AAJ7SF95_9ACAR|nr:equilibrative nucleoside transporter 2 [Galendromus occidentalis]